MFKFDFNIKETMELVGKQVVVTCTEGDKLYGNVIGFTSKYDNDLGVASVEIISDKFNSCVSIFENEILSIETK